MIDEEESSYCPLRRISSIQEVGKKIRALRLEKKVEPHKICVVLDFHGVIVEEAVHQKNLTIKEDIIKLFQYMQKEGIPYIIATAWASWDPEVKFNDVINEGIRALGLQDFFEVDPFHMAKMEELTLGVKKTKFKVYRNGRVVAIKHANSYARSQCDNSEDKYFRQKAYAIELCYPDNDIEYILFVDDSKDNLDIFKKDTNNITQTKSVNFQDFFLYHLQNPK
jgi:hypothetical protein